MSLDAGKRQMEITVTTRDGLHIAKLEGVLEESDRRAVQEQLHSLIEDPDSRVVVDLSGVPRMTSSGLGLLVTLVARANTKGAKVVLAAPTPFVASVLKVTRLDNFFGVAPTIDDAIRRLS
jgi:anti-sigma B factor antagonist